MKYKMLPIHIHKFIVPEIGKTGLLLDGKLHTTAFNFKESEKSDLHHLKIDWKYRVSLAGEHLFSYLGESKFVIQDDGIPFNYTQLDRFIMDMYLNFEMGWEEQTQNTRLAGSTIVSLEGENLVQVRRQVIDLMQ